MSAAPPKNSKELGSAVHDEFKRQAIDAAKKRAVAQHVDYDTFKNMVLVAHLKPLQAPKANAGDSSAPAWTFNADGSIAKTQAASVQSIPPQPPTSRPNTNDEFQREWRRNCVSPYDKYAYIRLCSADCFSRIFRVEINAKILGEIIQVLNSCWLTMAAMAEEGGGSALEEAVFVLDILQCLTGSGRFGLNIRLMPNESKAALSSLFKSLGVAQGALHAEQTQSEGMVRWACLQTYQQVLAAYQQPVAINPPHSVG